MSRLMRGTLMCPMPDEGQEPLIEHIEEQLVDHFSGFSRNYVHGGYKYKDSGVVHEAMLHYTVVFPASMAGQKELNALALYVKEVFEQEKVFCLVEYVDTDGGYLV